MNPDLRLFLTQTAPPRLDPTSNIIAFFGKKHSNFVRWMSRYDQTAPELLIPHGRNFVSLDGTEYIFVTASGGALCGRSIKGYIISHEWLN